MEARYSLVQKVGDGSSDSILCSSMHGVWIAMGIEFLRVVAEKACVFWLAWSCRDSDALPGKLGMVPWRVMIAGTCF